jgi:death on curing protein
MARARQTLRATLRRETIIEINRRQIERFGGGGHPTPDNFQNPGTLDHVLQEIRGSLFGTDLYPTIPEKAAIISYRIMSGHVFFDGNKRTGIEVCELFLGINGYMLDIKTEETVNVAIGIADSQNMQYEEYLRWITKRLQYSSLADFIIGVEIKIFQWIQRG